MRNLHPVETDDRSAGPRMLSSPALTWWNSSIASRQPSNASTPSSSTAKRKVAWVQTSTRSGLPRNSPTAFTFDFATRGSSIPGALHRFHCGATLRKRKNSPLRLRLCVAVTE